MPLTPEPDGAAPILMSGTADWSPAGVPARDHTKSRKMNAIRPAATLTAIRT
jgi:hypothetical protein